jgi:hypothetical protein
MVEEFSPEQIEEMLHSEVIGRIGCYADGKVYVVPITYAYQSDFIYGFTQEGKKVAMMRKNPEVCFEIDRFENLHNWRSVIIQGVYEELAGDERSKALQVMKNRIMPFLIDQNFGEGTENQSVIYRIKITKKSGRFESN